MTARAQLTEPVYGAEISPTAIVGATDEAFVVAVDVPGFRVDELQVELVDRSLRVQGTATPRDDLLRPEFEFWFALPPLAEDDAVTAVFEDGVLTIHAPLRPSRPPRPIEIATRS